MLLSFLSIFIKRRQGFRILLSDLSLKNKNSPRRVLTASKDISGLHISDNSGSGELGLEGTTGTSGDAGGGPKGNRLKKAKLGEMWPLSVVCFPQTL